MAKIIERSIDSLIPDDKNFNKGTEYGDHLMDESLRKFGLGRSILLDKNDRIIAGNKTTEKAAELGFENVLIVETDGNTLVAVKRKDIDLDSAKGRELALAD
ncbi:MAG: SAM-dependent methyltransferase, partial [Bacteroidales bacterium]|nr:SAM-dependent methyltransferase [Bacteroidales bacterium]